MPSQADNKRDSNQKSSWKRVSVPDRLERIENAIFALTDKIDAIEAADAEQRDALSLLTNVQNNVRVEPSFCFKAAMGLGGTALMRRELEIDGNVGVGLDTVKFLAKIKGTPKIKLMRNAVLKADANGAFQVCFKGSGRLLNSALGTDASSTSSETSEYEWLEDIMARLEGAVADELLMSSASLGITDEVPDQMSGLVSTMSTLTQVTPNSPEEMFQLGDTLRSLKEQIPGPPVLREETVREFEMPSILDIRICEWAEGSDEGMARSIQPLCDHLPEHDGELIDKVTSKLDDLDFLLAIQDEIAAAINRIEDTMANLDTIADPELPAVGGGAGNKPLCGLAPRLRPRSCPGSTR